MQVSGITRPAGAGSRAQYAGHFVQRAVPLVQEKKQ